MKNQFKRFLSCFLALILLAALLPISPAKAAGTAELPVKDWPDESWEVLRLTNKERMAEGLLPLAVSVKHQAAATVRAEELVDYYYADHSRPDGSMYNTALDEQSIIYRSYGENIAKGQKSALEVVTAWMNSPGHRANILREKYRLMGAGFVPVYDCWTQDFTGPDKGFSSMELAVDGTNLPVNGVIDSLGAVVILHGESCGDCYMPLIGEMCSWTGSASEGTYTVTASYDRFSTQFTVTVSSAPSTYVPPTEPTSPQGGVQVSEGDWQADITGGKATITAYSGKTGSNEALTVPDQIKGYAVTGIGAGVFKGKSFFSITLPAALKSIGANAFEDCACAGPLILPEGLETIGGEAFYGADFTGRVYIPASVRSLGTYAFSYMRNVTAFAVSPSNAAYSSYGGALLNKDKTVLLSFPIAYELEDYIVPESVTMLYCTSFAQSRLKNLYVPNYATDSMGYTFYWTDTQVWCQGVLASNMVGLNSIGRVYAPLPLDIRDASPDTLQTVAAAVAALDQEIPMEPEKQREQTPVSTASYSIRPMFFGDGNISYGSRATTRNGDIAVIHNNPYSIRVGSSVQFQVMAKEGSKIISACLYDESGKRLDARMDADGIFSFTMPDSTVYAYVWAEEKNYTTPRLPFNDVGTNDYFYLPVAWALEEGVTTGTTEVSYSPQDTCTRAQVLTFLWRAMGSPEPKSLNNPFKDVYSSDYFYKPVLWAVENGITNGTSATAFSPYSTCTVAHIVTFICRAIGQDYQMEGKPWYWRASAFMSQYITGPGYVMEQPCPRGNVALYLYKCRQWFE